MSSAENAFRTAVVGGFNRQDVLNYIETSAKEGKERITALEKEGEEVRKARDAAQQEVAEAKAHETALQRELAGLQKSSREAVAALETLRAERVREQQEAAAIREELDALREKALQWESGAKSYDVLKDRTATIELEAHQRARAIECEAEAKAKKLRTEAEQVLYKVQAGYGRLRGDVDATISHASGELGRVDKALEQVRAEFAEHDVTLERLLQSCRDCTSRKVPLQRDEK